MKRKKLLKAYAALGVHESRLEIALLCQFEGGRRSLALRSVSLPQGVICAESGKLTRPTELRGHIQEALETMVTARSIDLMIGIPDNLCRNRTVRMKAEATPAWQSAACGKLSCESGQVVDISPKSPNIGSSQEAFMVSCATEDVMRYVSAVARKGSIVTNLTPLMVARFNYLADCSLSAGNNRLLVVHACENACDIALWSEELLLYREHITRHDTVGSWVSTCDKRAQQVASRIGGVYSVVVRAPRELASLIDENSQIGRTSAVVVDDTCRLAHTIEGDRESLSSGYFDAALGLLTQSSGFQEGRCD
jgi:hypothetical protein